MEKEYDYLIIGLGLAGSCLALELCNLNKRILVFDDPNGKSSSKVAGGLINPVTGRKMTLTWKAEQLFPYLDTFYSKASKQLKAKFYFKMPIYRPFISTAEQNEWHGKSIEPEYINFVEKVHSKSEKEQNVNDPFGGIVLKNSGFLKTTVFLDAVKDYLKNINAVLDEKFDLENVNFNNENIVYKKIKAKKVIFCEGVQAAGNPYFKEIKFRPVKGEVLSLKLDEPLNKIYNRGVFILPRDGVHVVGSNYNHKTLDWEPSLEAKEEILHKLDDLLCKPYKIVGHKAGVRPAIADRRPVLGASKWNSNIVIFNGLGTKGVSLAPYFAQQLAEWLVNNKPIKPEVAINRFY